jgi:hypothetical protein
MPEPIDNPPPDISQLISLGEAAEICGLSPAHLRLLVGRGEIWGRKIGRNWVTTLKSVNEYVSLGHHPGPKPKQD